MKKFKCLCLFTGFVLYSFPLRSEIIDPTLKARKATVKIMKTYIEPDYCAPWKMKNFGSAVGSGVIIKGGTILTNAHVVSDATFIQVQKENDPYIYQAEVLFVAHECDLALLKVKDDNFYNDIAYFDLGGIPELKSIVATYGYPIGGERISITEGVVSRLEIGVYSHSSKSAFLMIQTDAAINFGNSGGPVIQKGKIVGIAFQARADSSNIGYMIPIPIIKHFLEDISDGKYDGFPDLGVFTDELMNESYRKYLSMREDQSGIIITNIINNSSAENYLRKGDVLHSIDGNVIANDGSIIYGDGRLRYSVIIDQKQIGDSVVLEVLRDRKMEKITVPLKFYFDRITWFNEFEILPRYFVFGGIVFQPLNREFLKCWDDWWYKADRKMLYYFSYLDRDNLHKNRKEFIVINHILPDAVNTYVSKINNVIVNKVNGRIISNLEDIIEAVKKPAGKFHIIEVEGNSKPIILKASLMEEANKRILKKYDIETDGRLNKETGYGNFRNNK